MIKRGYLLFFWLLIISSYIACSGLSDEPTFTEETNAPFISTSIASSNLPLNIRNYLEEHFLDILIVESLKHNHQGVISYSVTLVSGEHLLFTPNGILLAIDRDGQNGTADQDGMEIRAMNLPVAILQYIIENYPNAVILFTEEESDGQFEIYLDNGLELHFDKDGNFISTENDDDDDGLGAMEESDDDDDGNGNGDDDDDNDD